jgi:hypothetical protein
VKPNSVPWLLLAAFAAYPLVHAVVVDPRPLLGIPGQGSFFVQPKFYSAMAGGALALLALAFSGGRTPLPALLASFRSPIGVAWWVAFVGFSVAPLLATIIPAPIGYLGFIFRGDGALLMMATLLVMAAYARYSFLFPAVGRAAMIGFAAGALVVGFVAALQSFGIDFWLALGVEGLGVRPPRSTTGSHGFTSAIAGVGTMLLIGLATSERWRTWNRSTALFAGALAAMALMTAIAGGRSAILGVLLALIVWAAWLLLRVRGATLRRAAVAFGIVAVAIAAGTSLSDFSGRRLGELAERLLGAPLTAPIDPVRGGASAEGAAGGSLGGDAGDGVAPLESVDERLALWRIALRLIAKQPLLPYGSGAFTLHVWEEATRAEELTLITYRRPRVDPQIVQRRANVLFFPHPRTGEPVRYEAVIDKAHNYLLDLWLAFGAWPTLAFTALLILLFVRLLRAATPATFAIALGMIAYAAYAMAWFVGTAVEPMLFALLGAGWGIAERTLRAAAAPEPAIARAGRAELRRGRAPLR